MLEELDFLKTSTFGISNISFFEYIIGFIHTMILSYYLRNIYNTYSNTFSNKKVFSNLLPFFTISIFVIVIIIKSSLALSLGLVGALSIIRMRTAIKEAEQIIFLLISTAVAISSAAGAYLLPLFFVSFIHANYYYQFKTYRDDNVNLDDQLVITSDLFSNELIDEIITALNGNGCDVAIQSIKKDDNRLSLVLKISNFSLEYLTEVENIFKEEKVSNVELQVFNGIE